MVEEKPLTHDAWQSHWRNGRFVKWVIQGEGRTGIDSDGNAVSHIYYFGTARGENGHTILMPKGKIPPAPQSQPKRPIQSDPEEETREAQPCPKVTVILRTPGIISLAVLDGVWTAQLDHKAWGKRNNMILYFTEPETGAKRWLSVFWNDDFKPRDRNFDFRNDGYPGEFFILTTTHSPKTGNPVFQSAQRRDNDPTSIALYKQRAELLAQVVPSEVPLPSQ